MKHPATQPLPFGISDFKALRERNCRYVDKTHFIRDIIDADAQVLLLPRPRRFGKTLNLSTLRYFFEQSAEERRALFDGLLIAHEPHFQAHQGKYPVIFLTFKDVKGLNWQDVQTSLYSVIGHEIERYQQVWQRDGAATLSQKTLQRIAQDAAAPADYADALRLLSEALYAYYDAPVVILIDEYDAPILSGHVNGYYREIVSFMRNFLSGGLKDNPHLFKGVLTGILRIAKESIFSGLNNLAVYNLLRPEFRTAFGFTQPEVSALLTDYALADRGAEVAAWYNGYLFGGEVIYNPWSVLNYIASEDHHPRPYWINTGDPAIIESLVTRGSRELREEIGKLMSGEMIEKPIDDSIVIPDLETRDDLLWSFLLFSGYLKAVAQVDEETFRLQIPNHEVLLNYRQWVRHWFTQKVESNLLEEMLRGLENGDVVVFERMLRRVVTQIMSYHDLSGEPEKVYHALVLGMLVWLSGKYEIRSNRESGYGRYDVLLRPKNPEKQGIIIEFKRVYDDETPEDVLTAALRQIQERRYLAELDAAGIHSHLQLAVAFRGKELWVRQG
ncbi:hypothetical protein U14_04489 [Candidatus Moduliflexus flocculans]|uniref:AAA-ATPase-like domain-containing protein n=1 Tax=Candidatus Moduliflexus flocculans TaxID=1499966 RepID=A0A0S6W0L3_9BACT|nr:hypothetical protein U14_04489 [Candidatus Moduliflexus flocculans]